MSDLHLETEPANSAYQPAREPAALGKEGIIPQVAPTTTHPVVPAWDLLRVGGGALFLSPAHLSVLESLMASLLGGVPLVALTGPAGVGKTALVEAAIPLLTDRSLRVVRIEHPDGEELSLDRLLGAVLGMPADAVLSEDDAARACEALLIPPNGKRATVAVIDHAHMLQPDAARMLAMLSNQAGLTGHTLQMLFVARNELFDVLHDDTPGDLLGRITTRLAMEPYSEQDARGFIERRLGLPSAGNGEGSEGSTAGLRLSESALSDILQRGDRLPGQIVASLDAVMEAARRRGRRRVTGRMVRRALATPAAAGPSRRRLGVGVARVAAVLALAVLAVGGWAGVSRYARHNPVAELGKPPVIASSASGPATTVMVPIAMPSRDIEASKQPGVGGQPAAVASAGIAGPAEGKIAPPKATGAGAPEPGDRPPAAAPVVVPAVAPVMATAVAPGIAREAPAPVQPAVATTAGAPLPDSVRTALRERGDDMLAVGDVSAARRLYERAADAGSGEAAAAAGKTYDPSILALIGAVGIRPDPEQAASWYRRAVALGDQQAARWLKELGAPAR